MTKKKKMTTMEGGTRTGRTMTRSSWTHRTNCPCRNYLKTTNKWGHLRTLFQTSIWYSLQSATSRKRSA
jgi:hypothetical protein